MGAAAASVRDQVTGVILAGGRATRMGGVDKGLVQIGGRPMIAWVVDTLRSQVADVLINANRNHDSYRGFGCDVVDDGDSEFRGPLAGMVSGMRAARTPYIAVVPCDSPLLHGSLVQRLHDAARASGAPIAAPMTAGACSRCSRCSPASCWTIWLVISMTESVRSIGGTPGTGTRVSISATWRSRSPISTPRTTSAHSKERWRCGPRRQRTKRRI